MTNKESKEMVCILHVFANILSTLLLPHEFWTSKYDILPFTFHSCFILANLSMIDFPLHFIVVSFWPI